MEIVQPESEEHFSGRTSGRVLLGTVQGDIHDLGKNLLLMLLRCYGFTVLDLGVEWPQRFYRGRTHQAGCDRLVGFDHRRVYFHSDTVTALRAR